MLSLQREISRGCQPHLDEKESRKLAVAVLTLEKANGISALLALSRS